MSIFHLLRKEEKKRSVWIPIFVVLTFMFFLSTGCGKKNTKKSISNEYNIQSAKIVSHITSGIISPSSEIKVQFVNTVIDKKQIGKRVEQKILSFSPQISGSAKWKDRRTLIFIPKEKLRLRTKYSAIFHLENIDKFKKEQPVNFSFETAGREVSLLSGDFELTEKNDPKYIRYSGSLKFTEETNIQDVKNKISFILDGQTVNLKFSEEIPGIKYKFVSEDIMRGAKRKIFHILIPKDSFEISGNIDKKIVLEPIQDFKVIEVIKFDKGEAPGMEILFSDLLDTSQDIRGLVRIIPSMNISLKSFKKSIYISGDFKYGKAYQVKISGIKSKWKTNLKKEQSKTVIFEDKNPSISFSSNGVFLPSSNKSTIGFKTINVKEVKIIIEKVFESNLGQFLQTESLKSNKTRNSEFDSYELERVGVQVAEKKFVIGTEKNRWLLNQIDLNKLLKPDDKGLYIIHLSFDRKAMLYSGLKKKTSYYYGKEYYSNPNSWGYMYRHGSIYKPVIISDIGLTYKYGGNEHFVFATNIVNSSPMSGVKISLKNFQNQILASGTTDSDGKVFLKGIKGKAFMVEGEKNGQRSIVKPSEMGWNLSSFDIGGTVGDIRETRAFIFLDRGVYRPGDEINLSLIARNRDNSFPNNHPVKLKLYNPKNQLVKSFLNKKSYNGFYTFHFKTKETDITGNWKARLLVGSETFYKTIKIETVVPNRLKVKIVPLKKALDNSDKYLSFTLSSKYLFGAPAANLAAESQIALKNRPKKFPKYHGFIFTNEFLNFKTYKKDLFDGNLDSSGKKEINWKLPNLTSVPSAINAEISSKVYEKGGRFTANKTIIPIEPYRSYIGLEKPVMGWNYGKVGQKLNIRTILVTANGKTISGRELKYRIYRNAKHWWWEYDSLRNFRVRYKKDIYTRLVKESTIKTKDYPVPISFTPQDSGEYLIEVEESLGGGHKAGFFFSSYYWGETPEKNSNAGTLILKSNKKIYSPGEDALISFEKPKKGTILVTVEKGNKILNSFVYHSDDNKIDDGVKVAITDKMLPNVYLSVSIIQPHSQTINDRPIRIYGTIPLMVEQPLTHHNINIKSDKEFHTGRDFTVEIQTNDKKETQFTIAIVDEGLLDLTGFKSPNPWKYFFKKQKSGIFTYDLFNSVIGANKGDIYKLFSVGGEMAMTEDGFRSSQLGPKKAQRFKPVAMFKGPLKTDRNGYKKLSFKMPDYIGAVRIMVVAADGNRYGMSEKLVPVKTDLMILPTMPRVLGPGDSFELPVTIFAMKDDIKKVKLSLDINGPVKIIGEKKKTVRFHSSGEKDISFGISVDNSVGDAKITIRAKSGRYHASHTTDIKIRASSPCIYTSKTKEISPGETILMKIPDDGIEGSNNALISISKRAKLNVESRLEWLIRYPYGCIEQTVSSVFPQLYLKEFVKNEKLNPEKIDKNINDAIERLRRFELPTGGLSYWPGGKTISIWGTNYAAHFLIECKKRGYSVPSELYKGIFYFLKSRSLTTSDYITERIHRLYILALAGKPQIGPMNLIYENDLKTLSNINKWMLAASYYLAGKKSVKNIILKGAGTDVSEYKGEGVTFGSRLRDRALILDILTLFKEWNKADIIYDNITEELSSDSWFSTQSLGYSLLALGKYITANNDEFRTDDTPVKGYVRFPDGKKKDFSFKNRPAKFVINSGFGKQIKVHISADTSIKKVFSSLNWNGVPLRSTAEDESKNLSLRVAWYDEDGIKIKPSLLRQGTTFWARITVSPGQYTRRFLRNIALVQVIPAGWEIENTRLSGEDLPDWMGDWELNREDFLDIRDDRVMWFFNLPGRSVGYDFVIKLNCITAGKFILPPTVTEAMYNDKYRARIKGYPVEVIKR